MRINDIGLWVAILMMVIVTSCSTSRESTSREVERRQTAKREFRGAWIQTAFQSEYAAMTVPQLKKDFRRKLDFLRDCGMNAIIFQVRPEADAFYPSKIEPWSRFYTGEQGRAPEGNFDLVAFLVDECHKRGMEFHAWLNPYRASTAGNRPDGNWFHFVANPYWENLTVDGRAYVLNEGGTSFELQEDPVIPPFRCYMVANESTMDRVNTLRLAEGLPTSVASVTTENALRVWTEGGALCWQSDKAADVEIYSVNGSLVARYDSSVGVRRVNLSRGIYLVIADGKATKVIL